MKIAIIGGGAAGFFSAIRHKELYPEHDVTIYEKTTKVLGKVRISGGGRCNVTHACYDPKELVKYYPRGHKELLPLFYIFQPMDTMHWFESRGVALKVEDDHRVFPVSDSSISIVECFMQEVNRLEVHIEFSHSLEKIHAVDHGFELHFTYQPMVRCEKIIIASGSNQNIWDVVASIGHKIILPVPSLFTFNIQDKRIKDFPGTSWANVEVRIEGTKYKETGPLLITHWGMSGPAILKLSALAARELYAKDYKFNVQVNFLYPDSYNEVLDMLIGIKSKSPNKLVSNSIPGNFSARIWKDWITKLHMEKVWQSVSNKEVQRLAHELTQAIFTVNGKSTYKDEFVTCGGIDLREVDMNTMQSKVRPGIYFAGEVLNMDALTGGFNFQAAWTTGWVAGRCVE